MASAPPQERLSFFGGPVSTRREAQVAGWNLQPVAEPVEVRPSSRNGRFPAAPTRSEPVTLAGPTPPPVVKDPHLERLKQLKRSRNFGDLSEPDSTSRSSTPSSVNTAFSVPIKAHYPAHVQTATAGQSSHQLPDAKRPKMQASLKPGPARAAAHPQMLHAPRQAAARHMPSAATPVKLHSGTARQILSPSPSKGKTMKRGLMSKKGAASRIAAVAPTGGTSRRAAAEKAMKEQMDLMRAAAPPPKPRTAPSVAAASAAHARSVQQQGIGRLPVALPRLSQHSSARPAKPAEQSRLSMPHAADMRQAAGPSSLPRRSLISGLPAPKSLPSSQPAGARQQHEDWDEYEEEDQDDDAETAAPGNEDWRSMLQDITRYNPNRYGHDRDDRSMEVSWQQMQAEERRSARAGREADLAAEREEQRRIAEKKARKKLKKAGGKAHESE